MVGFAGHLNRCAGSCHTSAMDGPLYLTPVGGFLGVIICIMRFRPRLFIRQGT